MEELIKENFCNCCINKGNENCFELYLKEDKCTKTYKCKNYKREEKPFELSDLNSRDRSVACSLLLCYNRGEIMEEKSICDECMWECKQNQKIEKFGDAFVYCSKFRRKSENEDSL